MSACVFPSRWLRLQGAFVHSKLFPPGGRWMLWHYDLHVFWRTRDAPQPTTALWPFPRSLRVPPIDPWYWAAVRWNPWADRQSCGETSKHPREQAGVWWYSSTPWRRCKRCSKPDDMGQDSVETLASALLWDFSILRLQRGHSTYLMEEKNDKDANNFKHETWKELAYRFCVKTVASRSLDFHLEALFNLKFK